MNFRIEIGMSNADVIRIAKESGASEEVIQKINSIMESDTDGQISNDVELRLVEGIFYNVLTVPKANSENYALTQDGGQKREAKVDSMRVETFYNQRGDYTGAKMSKKNKGVTSELYYDNEHKNPYRYTETQKDGKVVRDVDLKSVFDEE